ncbi:hypothetical protein BU25DRAFT_416297 [Macroventuria anomochaeta]|uniref:Uncharacterized protein n=1 Tax=Macroventuria anomochaeta TaxID=301207 RepID=A0ACB6RH43_9PLEO|nr:uncharacterized protein BU25DRAFT_416297 [Macroventuria anomochaeta]KAF2621196.1 hypothetical protein BU25DRAFT_416297 [Macroventuria anomochaeta]
MRGSISGTPQYMSALCHILAPSENAGLAHAQITKTSAQGSLQCGRGSRYGRGDRRYAYSDSAGVTCPQLRRSNAHYNTSSWNRSTIGFESIVRSLMHEAIPSQNATYTLTTNESALDRTYTAFVNNFGAAKTLVIPTGLAGCGWTKFASISSMFWSGTTRSNS